MAFRISHLACFKFIVLANYLLSCSFSHASPVVAPNKTSSFSRDSFAPDFLFGTASSACQYEGAVDIDGRTPSIWDVLAHHSPEFISDGSNADVVEDFYHHYKDDIMLMNSLGLDAFRLSISWSRLIPSGKVSQGVNKKGVDFYNSVINELVSKGIKPFVTIFHWDIPQSLQDDYGGFISPHIMSDYLDFADVCFKEFGDRVKHWATFNEPFVYSTIFFIGGIFVGDLATDPYLVGHHQLLGHAEVVQLYRTKYKSQNGQIGMVLNSEWILPYSDSEADIKAQQRALDFRLGWFMDPITNGEYPKVMQDLVGNRLPKFSVEEAAMLKNSYDFLGLNYYTGLYVSNSPSYSNEHSIITDPQVNPTFERNGKFIGQPTGSPGVYVYPKGLYLLLSYINNTYRQPKIYITENGMPDSNNASTKELLNDHQRVNFLQKHLLCIKEAIGDGVKVKGYFIWSFLDTWEWMMGFTLRYGINFIDYENELKRIPKLSAKWIQAFLKGYK